MPGYARTEILFHDGGIVEINHVDNEETVTEGEDWGDVGKAMPVYMWDPSI